MFEARDRIVRSLARSKDELADRTQQTQTEARNPVFVVLLRFSTNKAEAGQFMADHNAWIRRGFDEGVFLLAGGVKPGLGGAILAHNTSLADLGARVDGDPFVVQNVVTAEILEVAPSRTDDRLSFLLS